MEINEFAKINVDRCYSAEAKKVWGNTSTRNLNAWALCIGGEAGELLNAVKKYTMYNPPKTTEKDIVDEVADVIIYAFILLDYLKVDVEQALIDKFNEVSRRINYNRIVVG